MVGPTGTHGTTFGGSPLACALGYHVLSRLSDEAFVENIRETSVYLRARLEFLTQWFPDILEEKVRGRGLILGLQSVPETVEDAARGLGLSDQQRLWRLEWPAALPSTLAGIRTALVLTVATATLAPLVGAGGLGVPIIAGLGADNLALILEGAVPVALLALLCDWTLRVLERGLTPWAAGE